MDTGAEDLTTVYLKDANLLPVRVWIGRGVIPLPEWPDADMAFVLDAPPLDIPVVADVLKLDRKLVLVTGKAPQGGVEDGSDPVSEFFALPAGDLAEVLKELMGRKAPVFHMSFQKRRPRFLRWLPEVERDSFPVDGEHFVYYFDEYHQYKGSFEFDDAYRRTSLRECTFAQSVNHFLHVLEELPFTNIPDSATKRCLFQSVFPFYTGERVAPDVYFAWKEPVEPIPGAIVGDEIKRYAAEYAMAVSCLSEVAAAFTHRGRHDLYCELMGDLVRLEGGKVVVASFSKEQTDALRRMHPFLYLHVFYRTPNQRLIAAFDKLGDGLAATEIVAAAEDLLQRLNKMDRELHLVKRSYEITALSGTLAQLKTYTARARNDREILLGAKEDASRAARLARPDDASRDANYWIGAVLTDWTLFTDEARNASSSFEEEQENVLTCLGRHLGCEADNHYNIMVAFLGATVEAEFCGRTKVLEVLGKHGFNDSRLDEIFRGPSYDQRRMDAYAICLAAGYAALLAPVAHWSPNRLDFAMQKAYEFFFEIHGGHRGRDGRILGIVALKHAACRLFHLRNSEKLEGAAREAGFYLSRLDNLDPPLSVHDKLKSFFRRAAEHPEGVYPRDVLRTVMLLPY